MICPAQCLGRIDTEDQLPADRVPPGPGEMFLKRTSEDPLRGTALWMREGHPPFIVTFEAEDECAHVLVFAETGIDVARAYHGEWADRHWAEVVKHAEARKP